MGFERRPQRALQHVSAAERHHLNEAALGAPHIRSGAEAADLDGLDPAGTGEKERAAQTGMVDRGAVERIGVGLVRRAAPDVIGPRTRREGDQLTEVERGRKQGDLADREPGA